MPPKTQNMLIEHCADIPGTGPKDTAEENGVICSLSHSSHKKIPNQQMVLFSYLLEHQGFKINIKENILRPLLSCSALPIEKKLC